MQYIPEPMVFVVGLCLGTVISIMLMTVSLYFDHKRAAELEVKNMAQYTCRCDTSHEKFELIGLIKKRGGKILQIILEPDSYIIEYESDPDDAALITLDWMRFDEFEEVEE